MRSLHEISLADRDRRAVEQAADILRRQFPVEQVILFGSKARGDDRADSDIDLLILTTRLVSHKEREQMTRALFDVQLDLGVLISRLVVPLEQWKHGLYQVLPIRSEVERDGVTV